MTSSSSILSRSRTAGLLSAALGVALTGCAARGPAAPTVLALPAEGESFAFFQQHDTTCRQYASAQIGGGSPGQAAAKTGVADAVIGTGVGAAAGALLGSASGHAGNGAAIGAGTGLLAGGLIGSASGKKAAAATQNQYNTAYTQCMVANGERISQPAPPPTIVYAAPPPPVVYAAPRVIYAAPPPGAVYVPAPGYAAAPPSPPAQSSKPSGS